MGATVGNGNGTMAALAQQCHNDSKVWFPEQTNDLGFMALALAGEVGELCNIVKKVERGSVALDDVRAELAEEAADVLTYLLNVFALTGTNPDKMYALKRAKNIRRFGNGNSGD